jgi:SNF2 family DNA or RNA helicase
VAEVERWREVHAPDRVVAQLVARRDYLALRASGPQFDALDAAGVELVAEKHALTFRVPPVALATAFTALGPWGAGIEASLRAERPDWFAWLDAEAARDAARAVSWKHLAALSGADGPNDLVVLPDYNAFVATIPADDPFHALYAYQRFGVYWLHRAQGRAILGDEMGLGKTPQALVAAARWPDCRRLLVVAPASVTGNWHNEGVRWAPDVPLVVLRGSRKVEKDLAMVRDPSVPRAGVVVSWGLLHLVRDVLEEIGFDTVIGDEAHRAKEMSARRTQAFVALAHAAPRRLLLTGTYVRSRPREMWALLHALVPRSLAIFAPYGDRYCKPKKNHTADGRVVKVYRGAAHLDELRRRTMPWVLRRTKAQVLPNLPPKRRQFLPIEADAAVARQLRLLEAELAGMEDEERAYGLLARMRQIVGLAKVEAALEWIEDAVAQGEPVVTFLHHTSVHEALCKGLDARKIRHVSIVGGVPNKRRTEIAQAFQDGEYDVFLGSAAAQEGLTLTRSSHTFHIERWLVPGEEEQAEDRVHRIGQFWPVQNTYLRLVGTVDDKIHALVEQKRATVGAIMDRTSVERDLMLLYCKGRR